MAISREQLDDILMGQARRHEMPELMDRFKGKTQNLALAIYNELHERGIDGGEILRRYAIQKSITNSNTKEQNRILAMNQDKADKRAYKTDYIYKLLNDFYDNLEGYINRVKPELKVVLDFDEIYLRIGFFRELLKNRKMGEEMYSEISRKCVDDYLDNPRLFLSISLEGYEGLYNEYRRLRAPSKTE